MHCFSIENIKHQHFILLQFSVDQKKIKQPFNFFSEPKQSLNKKCLGRGVRIDIDNVANDFIADEDEGHDGVARDNAPDTTTTSMPKGINRLSCEYYVIYCTMNNMNMYRYFYGE